MGDPVSAVALLAGVRVVTTRGASGDERLRTLLEAAGAEVLAWPTSEYPPPRDPRPLEAARARPDRFDWVVFTSARAVAAVGDGAEPRPGSPPPTPRVAVVGPATARAAAEAGWAVAVEGRGPGARGLAGEVAATFPLVGARVLFPAASGAAPTVEEEFAALGARVTRVEAYRTVVTPPPAARVRADLAAGLDAVTFASPSAVEAVDRALGGEMAGGLAGLTIVCIGPTTATALARRGVSNVRVAATATLEGMVEALVDSFGNPGSGRRDADLGHASLRVAVQSREAGRPDANSGRAAHTLGAASAPNPDARP